MPRRKPEPEKAPAGRRREDHGVNAKWRVKRLEREARDEREGEKQHRQENQP